MTMDSFMAKGNIGLAESIHSNIVKAAFMHIAYIQKTVNMATFLGAYNKYMAENPGAKEKSAVIYAETVVRTTQSGAGAKDLASIQSKGEFMRMVTMFYTYFSVLYNRERQMFKNMKKIGNMPKAIASFMWLIASPVLVESLLKGHEPEDDEGWAEWFAMESMLYATTSIPWVRDVANGLLTDYGYSFTPAQGMVESFIRAGKKGVQGEYDEVFWRNTVNAMGVMTHIPTGQAMKTFDYIFGGESEEPVREFFVGRKRN